MKRNRLEESSGFVA